MARDQQVVAADHPPSAFQITATIRRVIGRVGVEVQHIQPGSEPVNLLAVVFRARGLPGTVQQLG
jgi:hypothetical protein